MNKDFSSGELIRQVPYSVEAEQAVLGSIILEAKTLDEVVNILHAEDFYIDKHVEIYRAAQELYLNAKCIDVVTLIDMLVKSGTYNRESGGTYLKQLADSVPSLSNCKDYALIVRDKALLRRLIAVAEEVRTNAFEQSEDTSTILDDAERRVFELSEGYITQDFSGLQDVFLALYQRLDLLRKNKGALGIMTHFSDLDKVMIGMEPGDLVIVGARPGMGKTSFVLNIASAVARYEKRTVVVFSLEMSGIQIASRMLSSEARVSSTALRTGELSSADSEKLAKSASALSGCQILIDDSSNIKVSEMRAKLRRVKNLGLVVIDYLQLMRSDKKYDSNVLEVGDITRSLKIMAKELQVPILLCSQLSRSSDKRGAREHRPQLSDLRDSGAIEQDADVVLFLYRDDYYGENPENINKAECIVAKNRHGATRSVDLAWDGQYTRFSTLEHQLSEESQGPGSSDAPF